MPVDCVQRDGQWRLVEPGGEIAKTSRGKPRDGGGHRTEQMCRAQQRVINKAIREKQG